MKNAFQETRFLWWAGIFVVADAIVILPFWILVIVISLLMHSWTVFFLAVSLFWVVRSLGEVIYWMNEQFATHHRNDPKNLFGYSLVRCDAIWFLYQLFWQCVMVLALLSSIYFVRGLEML